MSGVNYAISQFGENSLSAWIYSLTTRKHNASADACQRLRHKNSEDEGGAQR